MGAWSHRAIAARSTAWESPDIGHSKRWPNEIGALNQVTGDRIRFVREQGTRHGEPPRPHVWSMTVTNLGQEASWLTAVGVM